MTETLRFGYNRGLPEDAEVAWGCRAIVRDDGYVDVVWDRQDAFGPDAEREEFLRALRDEAGMKPFDTAGDLLASGQMQTRVAGEFLLYASDTLIVKGNTNASAGYLYVCAFPIDTSEEG